MTNSARGIRSLVTLVIAVSTAQGCGQISLGSTTTEGETADAGVDAAQAPYCGIIAELACGDVNRDARIDVNDALLLAQYVEGMPVTIAFEACDVDCDGRITNADAHMIASYTAGSISAFPCAAKQP